MFKKASPLGYVTYTSAENEIPTIMAQDHEFDVYKIGWRGPNNRATRVYLATEEPAMARFEGCMRRLKFEITPEK